MCSYLLVNCKCENCDSLILGHDIGDYGCYSDYSRPAYCHACGSPYPWTESAIKNACLILQEEENFTEEFKTSVSDILPDIIVETPKSQLAVVRIKKALASAGAFTADGIRQFVIDFGCELAKKSLGL